MKNLYAPWRSPYSDSHDKTKDENTTAQDCVFCTILAQNNDEHNFILKRYEHCFVVLNKYPYNAGHLMVLPNTHIRNLYDLPQEARHEIMDIITLSLSIIEQKLHSQGINVGLNSGTVAGAGIPSHLHFHVLPRWAGDTNFLAALANTKVISFDLKELYKLLKPEFKD